MVAWCLIRLLNERVEERCVGATRGGWVISVLMLNEELPSVKLRVRSSSGACTVRVALWSGVFESLAMRVDGKNRLAVNATSQSGEER